MIPSAYIPDRLQEINTEFQTASKTEKLQLLVTFAEQFPPLPERYQGKQSPVNQVHECMTPVYVYAELRDEKIDFFFSIPPESPTIRGYAAILSAILDGLTPGQVLQIPLNFYEGLGLQTVLSPQRVRGIAGIFLHVKKLAQRAIQVQGEIS